MALGNIYYFNPTCELAVANGSFSYQPPLLLQEMERDLAILPFVFCTPNDFVLTENKPSSEFQQKMAFAGFDLPRFCSLAELEAFPEESFEAIFPWGWSPAAHFRLKKLKEKCSGEFRKTLVFNWNDNHKQLFERSTALDFLSSLLKNNPLHWFIPEKLAGHKVTRCEEIDLLLEKHLPLVLKAPMSSSGRGIQIIRKPKLNTPNKQWISGILKQQNYLIAEPFLEKRADLSFQFRILSENEIEYLGFSIFETNTNGQYQRTFIHADLKNIIPEEGAAEFDKLIGDTATVLCNALKKSVYAAKHRGFLGIDALLLTCQGKLMIQPCIEINSRMNMGILTLFLEKRIHPKAGGRFELFHGKAGAFEAFATQQIYLKHPRFLEGKLYSGFLPLIEPNGQNKFGAYFSLGPDK